MKFLGEYNFEAGSAYRDKLDGEGVSSMVDEVGGYFGASWATMGTLRPRLRLFVEDGDYDKAVGLIKELEQGFEKKVEIDGKEADKTMLKIVWFIVGILAVYSLIIYLHI